MSLELHAFITAANPPSRAEWQAAIERLGYPLTLDPGLDLPNDSGFSPCRLEGNDSGFELYVDSAQEMAESYPQIKPRIGDCRWCISFRWGGNLQECACAFAAAAGLIGCSGAIVYDPQDDTWCDAAHLRREFDSCLSQ